jgi:hypothetical protein
VDEVYKLAAGKRRNNTQITTLRKPDGSLTEELRETLQLMLEYFTPVDKEEDESEHHKLARPKLSNLQEYHKLSHDCDGIGRGRSGSRRNRSPSKP